MSNLFYARSKSIITKTATEYVECYDFVDLVNASTVCDINPTPLQLVAENYRKAHVLIDGLPVVIETPQGITRRRRNPDGEIVWAREMPFSYGYISNTMDADFEAVDVFVGDFPHHPIIYILDQQHPDTKKFDEHKVFIWFRDKRQAKHCYYDSFDKKKAAKKRWMSMVGVHINDFKDWLKTDGTMYPIADQNLEMV